MTRVASGADNANMRTAAPQRRPKARPWRGFPCYSRLIRVHPAYPCLSAFICLQKILPFNASQPVRFATMPEAFALRGMHNSVDII